MMCKLAGIKIYRLPSVKGFDGENGQICTDKIFTLKRCRNKLCNMVHLFPTETDKAYPEQLVKMLSTGVEAAVYKNRGRKNGMTTPNNPECLSRPLGEECGNTAKGKSGDGEAV